MGWASGTEIAVAVARTLVNEVPDAETRKRIYAPLITVLSEGDWDTQDEALGIDPVLDELLNIELER